jgi:membrane protein YqaA with SNARE-associated domain
MELLQDLWHGLHDFLTSLLRWVEAFALTPYGSYALFGISFLESSIFPIPPDVLLIALCIGRPEHSFWFAAICALGSVLGGIAGYALGYFGGRPLLKKLFDQRKIEAVERLYDRYNAWATGIAGLTPIPYKIFTISGGAFAINFRIFVVASIVSRSFRFAVVAGIIYLYGEAAKAWIEKYLNVLSIAFVILLILGFWLIGRGTSKAVSGPEMET